MTTCRNCKVFGQKQCAYHGPVMLSCRCGGDVRGDCLAADGSIVYRCAGCDGTYTSLFDLVPKEAGR